METREEDLQFTNTDDVVQLVRKVYIGEKDVLDHLARLKLGLDFNISICSCTVGTEDKHFELCSLSMHEVINLIQKGNCSCGYTGPLYGPRTPVPRYSIRMIHIAVMRGHGWLLEHYIQSGGDINATMLNAQRPLLSLATMHMSPNADDVVRVLIDNQVDLNMQSSVDGITALMSAVALQQKTVIHQLIQAGCNLNLINHYKETALMIAIDQNFLDIAEMLVVAGCSVNIMNGNGFTPIMIASRQCRFDLMKILLQSAEIDLDQRSQHQGFFKQNTALYFAVYENFYEGVKLLLEHGANPDLRGHGGHTPLMFAALDNAVNIAIALVYHGCDVNLTNTHGYTALHLASWEGLDDIVRVLLAKQGIEYDARTGDFNTPLALACHGHYPDVVHLLLELSCDVNNADKDLDTPILYASYNGCLETVNALIAHGANPDCRNNENTTPLWNAIYKRHLDIVQVLLFQNVVLDVHSRGIDQHAETEHIILVYDDPMSPLYVACQRGVFTAAKWLLLLGVNIQNDQWLRTRNYPDKMVTSIEFVEWINDFLSNPYSLKQAASIKIRKILGRNISQSVSALDIPTTLKDYLLLSNLESFNAINTCN